MSQTQARGHTTRNSLRTSVNLALGGIIRRSISTPPSVLPPTSTFGCSNRPSNIFHQPEVEMMSISTGPPRIHPESGVTPTPISPPHYPGTDSHQSQTPTPTPSGSGQAPPIRTEDIPLVYPLAP